MKITTTILAACLCVTLVNSLPLEGFQSKALDRLMVSESDDESALRNKRTIGLLRQFFPEVSKMIEDKVNMIVGEVAKIFGPVLFRSILGRNNNNNNAGAGSTGKSESGSTVEVKNPFDDEDDSFTDDDDFFNAPAAPGQSVPSKINIQLPEIEEDKSTSTTTAVASFEETKTTTAKSYETTVADIESITPSVGLA